jgi:hypothetical protein
MGVSPGFRRLSLTAGIIGTVFILFAWWTGPNRLTIGDMAMGLAMFGVAPAVLVLLIGWVVAGFRS